MYSTFVPLSFPLHSVVTPSLRVPLPALPLFTPCFVSLYPLHAICGLCCTVVSSFVYTFDTHSPTFALDQPRLQTLVDFSVEFDRLWTVKLELSTLDFAGRRQAWLVPSIGRDHTRSLNLWLPPAAAATIPPKETLKRP